MAEPSSERQATTVPSAHPRRWLERLKINQFRSVEPGTELCFSEGLHVVLGKNATGKSTLLDIAAAALALNFDRPTFREEPLDLEITLRAGRFQFEAAVKRIALIAEARVPDLARRDEGRYAFREEGRYTFRAGTDLSVSVVLSSDELPQRTVTGVDPARYGLEEPLGRRHRTPPLSPGLHLLYDLWFQGALSKYPALETLLGKEVFSLGYGDQAVFRVPEGDELLDVIEDDDFEIWLGESIEKSHALLPSHIFDALPRDQSAIAVSVSTEPILSAFVREMGFDEARMFLGPPRIEKRHGFDTQVYSSPTFTFHRGGRLVRRADQLSYGQRRLFALGWYLVCNREIAVLDEPANGLHESWLAFLVSELRDRQVFLTSQNREMLDMLPFGNEMEIRRGFILCESRPSPGGGDQVLHWRGLREDESSLMVKALRASRLDLVTDVLRALNLW